MANIRILGLVTISLLWGAFGPENSVQAQKKDRAPVIEHDFLDADNVEAGLKSPMGDLLSLRKGFRVGSLIRPRTTFVPEMLRASENL